MARAVLVVQRRPGRKDVFAFRAFIASQMNTLMKADARVLCPKFGRAVKRLHAVNL